MNNRVQEFFDRAGLHYEVLTMGESTATVPLAAAALGVEEDRIAKSLTFKLKDRGIVIVACGTARIDNRKFKDAFGCKASMMSPDEALELTGYAVGGVCPFDLPGTVGVYLDESLRKFDFVYPAAGSSHSCVKIAPEEMARITNAQWTDVAKTPEKAVL